MRLRCMDDILDAREQLGPTSRIVSAARTASVPTDTKLNNPTIAERILLLSQTAYTLRMERTEYM